MRKRSEEKGDLRGFKYVLIHRSKSWANMSLCNMNVKEQKSSPKTGKRGLYTNNICFCYNIIDIVVYLSDCKSS